MQTQNNCAFSARPVLGAIIVFSIALLGACGGDDECGNFVLDPGETCDDGNRFSRDGCNSRCQIETIAGSALCYPTPNPVNQTLAGRSNCRRTALQPCVPCTGVGQPFPGQGYRQPFPGQGYGQPFPGQGYGQPFPGQGFPGQQSQAFCGDGRLTPPESCDPEFPRGQPVQQQAWCVSINCGVPPQGRGGTPFCTGGNCFRY